MKIIVLGYMGCGKSTIGKRLANKLSIKFIDLDAYIEEKEQQTIAELFATKGEIYFRLQETIYLKELLASTDDFILSLGGGTPCYSNNMQQVLTSTAISFYLRANIPTLASRLVKEKETRPLIAKLKDDDLHEYIGKHLFERAPFYEQATHKIDVNNKNIETIEAAILAELH